jgi:GTP-binding protein
MLTGRQKLAKTSSSPGKTQLINHFLINENWYLVDLPGYGFAKVSKASRQKFSDMINKYLLNRKNLICVFVLIDSRIPPQKIDLEFMEYLGNQGIPFTIVFTKIDKLSSSVLQRNLKVYHTELLKTWEALPEIFRTSAESKFGRDDILNYIEHLNTNINLNDL